mmetsp:Transcript_6710/g.18736  ORF Transcript_6710/g.18736 Transcript_6710/m.18736 type:complete len:227 (-) Transcript_6710:616-1296(-)
MASDSSFDAFDCTCTEASLLVDLLCFLLLLSPRDFDLELPLGFLDDDLLRLESIFPAASFGAFDSLSALPTDLPPASLSTPFVLDRWRSLFFDLLPFLLSVFIVLDRRRSFFLDDLDFISPPLWRSSSSLFASSALDLRRPPFLDVLEGLLVSLALPLFFLLDSASSPTLGRCFLVDDRFDFLDLEVSSFFLLLLASEDSFLLAALFLVECEVPPPSLSLSPATAG